MQITLTREEVADVITFLREAAERHLAAVRATPGAADTAGLIASRRAKALAEEIDSQREDA